MFVAWLTTDTSLIDPSHLSVSVDDVLSVHSLLMLPVLLDMLMVLPLRWFCVWKSCDQLIARDWSSWLSWRNLYIVQFGSLLLCGFFPSISTMPLEDDGVAEGEERERRETSKIINNHYLFIIYVCFLSLSIINGEGIRNERVIRDTREEKLSKEPKRNVTWSQIDGGPKRLETTFILWCCSFFCQSLCCTRCWCCDDELKVEKNSLYH